MTEVKEMLFEKKLQLINPVENQNISRYFSSSKIEFVVIFFFGKIKIKLNFNFFPYINYDDVDVDVDGGNLYGKLNFFPFFEPQTEKNFFRKTLFGEKLTFPKPPPPLIGGSILAKRTNERVKSMK